MSYHIPVSMFVGVTVRFGWGDHPTRYVVTRTYNIRILSKHTTY